MTRERFNLDHVEAAKDQLNEVRGRARIEGYLSLIAGAELDEARMALIEESNFAARELEQHIGKLVAVEMLPHATIHIHPGTESFTQQAVPVNERGAYRYFDALRLVKIWEGHDLIFLFPKPTGSHQIPDNAVVGYRAIIPEVNSLEIHPETA